MINEFMITMDIDEHKKMTYNTPQTTTRRCMHHNTPLRYYSSGSYACHANGSDESDSDGPFYGGRHSSGTL